MKLRGAKNLDLLLQNFDFNAQTKQGFILEGGSGSAKTYDIINFLIFYCSHYRGKGKDILIFRQTLADLKKTAYKDFLKILTGYGLYQERLHTMSAPINYRLYGNTIYFSGLDTPGAHGERHDIIWGNEGMELDPEAFKQLNQRCNEAFIVDYNPSATDHWIFDTLEKRPDTKKFLSTQLDNPFLPRGQRDEILRYEPTPENIANGTADDYLWNVYGLGIRSAPEGLIFQHVTWIDEFPKDVEEIIWGLDFGYTNSPSALCRVARHGMNLFAECVFYAPTESPTELIEPLRSHCGTGTIWADPSGKGMIAILRREGIRIMATNTYPGSIKTGISMMKGYKLHFVRGAALQKEQANYKYRTINGIKTDDPIDDYNHCFVGGTLISTPAGLRRIDGIEPGDMVLTSEGPKAVVFTWDNGEQQVKEYTIQLGRISVTLICTPTHKVKTSKGWIPISELQPGMTVYLDSSLPENATGCSLESGISHGAQSACTLLYGKQSTIGSAQEGTTFTTLTKTRGITGRKILKASNPSDIYRVTRKTDSRAIRNGLPSSEPEEYAKQRNGMQVMRAGNGIERMLRNADSGNGIMAPPNALTAAMISPSKGPVKSSVTRIASSDFTITKVYDLTVEGAHEYFANGLLVHNCIDAIRMVVLSNFR